MYGTIAHLHLKPGMEDRMSQEMKTYEGLSVPGYVGSYVYRMDDNPNELMLVVMFESKEAYRANAESAEQNTRYEAMRAMLQSDPEWHDGEIIYGKG